MRQNYLTANERPFLKHISSTEVTSEKITSAILGDPVTAADEICLFSSSQCRTVTEPNGQTPWRKATVLKSLFLLKKVN